MRRAFAVALCVSICLGGCAGSGITDVFSARENSGSTLVEAIDPQLYKDALYYLMNAGIDISFTGYEHFFDAIVQSHVEEVPAGEAGIRGIEEDPHTFGPWQAGRDFEATDAPADGSISEWYDNYFITHDWSEYGQAILTMQAGDTVTLNDASFTVEGVVDYPKESFYGEIAYLAGEDAIILQTCVPGRDVNRHVWGRPVE